MLLLISLLQLDLKVAQAKARIDGEPPKQELDEKGPISPNCNCYPLKIFGSSENWIASMFEHLNFAKREIAHGIQSGMFANMVKNSLVAAKYDLRYVLSKVQRKEFSIVTNYPGTFQTVRKSMCFAKEWRRVDGRFYLYQYPLDKIKINNEEVDQNMRLNVRISLENDKVFDYLEIDLITNLLNVFGGAGYTLTYSRDFNQLMVYQPMEDYDQHVDFYQSVYCLAKRIVEREAATENVPNEN